MQITEIITIAVLVRKKGQETEVFFRASRIQCQGSDPDHQFDNLTSQPTKHTPIALGAHVSSLESLHDLAETLPLDQLPEFLGRLEAIKLVAFARMISPAPAQNADCLLDIDVAAQRLNVSTSYLYRHAEEFDARRIGRSLRFARSSIDAFIQQQDGRRRRR